MEPKIMQSSRDCEERFRKIADSIREAIIVVDNQVKVAYWNPAAEKKFGYSSVEAIGQDIYTLIFPEMLYGERKDFIGKGVKVLAEAGNGECTAGRIEAKARRKDGSAFTAELSISPVKLAGKWSAVAVVKDISEHKKLEGELGSERSKLEAITQSIGAGYVIIGKDYHVLWANKFIHEYKGNVDGKLCFATLNDLDHVCPDCGVKKVFENNANYDAHEYTSIDIKGNPYWVELIATPIKDEKGNVTSAVEVCVDITEKKRMQSKLAEYSHRLENLVEERTRKLKEAEIQLVKRERLAAIGELAGMIGHDLRNPLTGIKNAAYLLGKKGASMSETQTKELIETINTCVDHSNKIINDLLDYSREIRLEPRESSLRMLLCESMSMVEIPRNVKVVNSLLHKQVLKVDSDKIKRVFVNLIKNAIDAMPNGGKLTINSKVDTGVVEISFSDTGSGIPDEVLSNLFSPLFTTKARGMGFGLAICKRIVEAHGGTITVKTARGKGTTFTLNLPMESKCEISEQKVLISVPETLTSPMKKP
ncbi:MAG TPA: PAS domain S-box protein [Candidatus Limnocylindrales bacterium]|nr:PAS domain S-box protein [Candidatus Limnocylindrales bacterium]